MNVLLINGSPHINGNTFSALAEISIQLNSDRIETEIVQIGNNFVRGCIACGKCQKLGKCIFDNDLVNPLVDKIREADGLIIGTPVYFASPNGTLISLLDRAFYSGGYAPFEYKPAACLAVARRGGTTASLEVINKYFGIRNMPVISSKYWNQAHGAAAGEIREDLEGMQVLRTLARNMAWMLKCIEAGRQAGICPPEKEVPEARTNFIR